MVTHDVKSARPGFFFLGEHWAIDHRHFQCWSLCKVCYAFPLPHGRRSECASSRCCLLLNGLFMLIHGAMTTRISRFGCRFRVPRLGGKVSFSLLRRAAATIDYYCFHRETERVVYYLLKFETTRWSSHQVRLSWRWLRPTGSRFRSYWAEQVWGWRTIRNRTE